MRLIFVLAGLIVCVLGMFSVLRVGQARSLVSSSRLTGSSATAGEAVRLSPGDPEAYTARALANGAELGLAVEDLRRAIALRPRDYSLWIELGTTLDRLGETQAALAALTEACDLAPSYSMPHWHRAVLFQKLDKQEEAFKEFRNATLTQPSLLPAVIEMAWKAYSGDCEAVERVVGPRRPEETLALAHFLLGKGEAGEALKLIRSVDKMSYFERRQFVVEFLDAKQFTEAYELWTGMREKNSISAVAGTIDDGSFETGRLSDEPGFAWKVNEIPGTNLSIDQSDLRNGKRSMRVDWKGTPDPSEEVVSQLILVDPNTQYQLNCFARAEELVTGGAPVITVTDVSKTNNPSEPNNKRLAQSLRLPLGTSEWQSISLGFTTTNSTRAVRIGLQRESCPERPCPIFGSLWLDDFSLIQESILQSPKSKVEKANSKHDASGKQNVSDN